MLDTDNSRYDLFLPVVKPEIAFPIHKELSDVEKGNMTDKEYVMKHLKVIDKANPTIAIFIKEFAKNSKDPTQTAFLAVLVYKMLQNQAECNLLEELTLR